jgi:hypothetical protein
MDGQPHPTNQQQQQPQQHHQAQANVLEGPKSDKELLNSYIYDYLVKHNLLDSARTFHQEIEQSNSRTNSPSSSNGNSNIVRIDQAH